MPRGAALLRSARAQARRFTRARQGVAAVEFALIVPLMLLVYVGVVELTQALANSRKVTQLSRTLADLSSRSVTLSQSDVDGIFAASSSVLAPFSTAKTTMVISAIGVYKVGSTFKAYVCSSARPSPKKAGDPTGPIRAEGLPATVVGLRDFPDIPEAFKQDQMRYILAEVGTEYAYVLGQQTYEAFKLKPIVLIPEQTSWPVRTGKTYNGNTNPEIVLPTNGKPCPAKIT